MNEAMYIRADGSINIQRVRPTLEEAQEFVGGFVEKVDPQGDPECQMLVNEDGQQMGLPVNIKGTMLYQHGPIVGDIILLRGNCRWID